MKTNSQLYKYLTIFILINTIKLSTSSCRGCLELDELTFDKMLSKFQYSLVKFDIAFPYGEKHELFADFAKKYGSKYDNLMFSLVGVKDYGEKDNSALAERFKVDEKKYPEIILFRDYSSEHYVKYPVEWELNADNLKKFIRENSELYIGLDGCLKEFDDLVIGFIQSDSDEQKNALSTATKLFDQLKKDEDKDNAKIYMNFMKRIMEKGSDFVVEEKRRLSNLLAGKVSDKKRYELTKKRNVLESFKTTQFNLNDREEL